MSVDDSFGECIHSIYKQLDPHKLSTQTFTVRNPASNHSSCFTDHFWQHPLPPKKVN